MKFSLSSVDRACAFAFLLMLGAPHAIAADNDKVAAELKTIIDSGEPSIGNEDNDERIVEVYVFYAADRDYKPIWVRDTGPKSKAKEALAVFKAANDMGLNPANYRVAEIEKRMNATNPHELAELGAAAQPRLHRFRPRHQSRPRRAQDRRVPKTPSSPRNSDRSPSSTAPRSPRAFRNMSARWNRRRANITASNSRSPSYRDLEAKGGWPTVPKGPALKPDMNDKRVPILAQASAGDRRPSMPTAQGEGDLYDDDLVEAVKRFQERHGLTDDGIIAETTLEAMNVPIADRIRQMELNLERRRWMDDDLGDYYIFVNVADQEMKVVRNEKDHPHGQARGRQAL